jgi:hypothetical protein
LEGGRWKWAAGVRLKAGGLNVGRLLIVLGLVLAAVGVLINLGFPIGRLPGDFSVRRGNFSFYFPLATSILASLILTLIMMFFGRR